jgi:flagellar operon protein (TIGR03826 family)
MNVRNCRYCRRLFNHVVGPPICPTCRDEKEKKFQEVKKYIQDHRGATIHEVSEECDVEVNQINQWIREERLQFSEDSPIRVKCEKCGEMIRAGVYCDKCKAELANTLGSAYKKELPVTEEPKKKQSEKDKMRFL